MAPLELKNTYWMLRHGRSKANEAGLIVSDPANGVKPEYGLTPAGREQATAAGLRWKAELGDAAAATLLIVASPFSRTVETATLASAAVGISPGDARFQTHPSLRERHFGDFELQTHDHYKTVWVEDARDLAWRPPGGGESVADVAARGAAVFAELEAAHTDKHILLVAHGDTLSILTAVAKGTALGGHRDHAQDTGELRRLTV